MNVKNIYAGLNKLNARVCPRILAIDSDGKLYVGPRKSRSTLEHRAGLKNGVRDGETLKQKHLINRRLTKQTVVVETGTKSPEAMFPTVAPKCKFRQSFRFATPAAVILLTLNSEVDKEYARFKQELCEEHGLTWDQGNE